jgi:hypothetical protein
MCENVEEAEQQLEEYRKKHAAEIATNDAYRVRVLVVKARA